MDDPVETLLVDVRASTQGFAQDVATMRAAFDGTLVTGFERAGSVLERGLSGAIRRGSLSFEDLRRVALNVIDEIAAQAVHGLFAGGGGTGGLLNLGGLLGPVLGSVLGLPGAPPAGRSRPGAAIWWASADPSCSCRLRPGASNPQRPRAAAICASRSPSPALARPPLHKRSSAPPARWRARCAGR